MRGSTAPSPPSLAARSANPIHHVFSKKMSFRQERVIEIVAGVPAHPDFLHDAARSSVLDRRDGDDLREPNLLEAKRERGAGAFRRVPAAPVVGPEPPPDLGGRKEWQCRQANKPGECRDPGDLDRPEPIPVLVEVDFDPIDEGVAQLARKGGWQELA